MTQNANYEKYYIRDFKPYQFMELFCELVEKISTILPEVKNNTYNTEFIYNQASTLGQCRKRSNCDYTIYLNYYYARSAPMEMIEETIVHELLHSCRECMAHTGRWKRLAALVNEHFGYHISRTSSVDGTNYKYIENMNRKQKKYALICNNCNHQWSYTRKTDLIKSVEKDPHGAVCPYCKKDNFKVSRLGV